MLHVFSTRVGTFLYVEMENALNAPFIHIDVSALVYPFLASPNRPTQFSFVQLDFPLKTVLNTTSLFFGATVTREVRLVVAETRMLGPTIGQMGAQLSRTFL